MSLLPPVVAVLTANISEFSAKMGEARAEMGLTEGAASKAGVATKTMALGFGLAAADIAVHAVRLADDFQANMALIHTQAGAFHEDIGSMSNAVLKMAGEVGQKPVELAKGLYHIESAGFRGATALDMLRLSGEGASVGLANMEDVTQGVIGIMAAHIKGVNNATDAMGWLNATVGTGDMRMEDFAKSLQNGIVPVFANAGLGAKDFAAAVATITDNATKPQVATTHLLHTVAMMEAPTNKAKDALKGLGMTQFQLASDMRGPGGLQAAVHDLQEHLKTLNPNEQNAALSAIFGGGKSFGTIQELQRELGRLDDKYASGKTAVKSFAQSWAETQHTFKQTNAEFEASMESGMIRVGNLLLPVLADIEHWLMDVAHWIEHHKVAWAALAGIGALVVEVLAEMAVGLLELAAPFIAAAAAAALIGAGLYELYQHSPRFRHMVEEMKQAVIAGFTIIKGWVHDAQQWWKQHGDQVVATASLIVHAVMDGIGAAITWLRDTTKEFLAGASKWWTLHGTEVSAAAHNIWTVIKTVFGALLEYWKFIWPFMSIVLKTAWNIITDVVKTAVKLIGDVIAIWMDVFSGHWSKLWRDVKKYVEDAFSGIWKIVKDWAAGAGDMLVQAGKDLVHGLINGIKSMVGAAGDAVKSLGSSILGTFTGHFKIGSPSKVMEEHGVFIGQGLANGILASTGIVVAAALAMSNAVRDSLTSASYGLGITGALVTGTSLVASAPHALGHGADVKAVHTTAAASAATAHHGAHPAAHHPAAHHPAHHAAHPRGPNEYVFDITLQVDGEKLWRVMRKETLKHEKRNGNNGLSAKPK